MNDRESLKKALKEKADGKKNSVGDYWGDMLCLDAIAVIEALEAENKELVEALEIVKANSLNPAHTMTKFGLEGVVDANYSLADKILQSLPEAEGKEGER